MINVRIWLTIAISLAPTLVHGQDRIDAPSPRFAAVLQAQQRRDAVLETAKHSTTWIKHGCTDATFRPMPVTRIWKPIRFDADGEMIGGVWGESVQATGCGMTRILNVATVVRSPGVLVTGILAPGTTKADPTLQRDASRFVFAAGMLHAAACQQAFIDDTKVMGQEPASSDGRLVGPVEVEQWMVSVCGQNVTVEVKFHLLPGRTDIVAHAL